MSGTSKGGYRTAATNKNLYGSDFYRRIGRMGGAAKVKKGFAIAGHASTAGRIGGLWRPTEEVRRRMSETHKALHVAKKLANK